jgi:hypothetical protein
MFVVNKKPKYVTKVGVVYFLVLNLAQAPMGGP